MPLTEVGRAPLGGPVDGLVVVAAEEEVEAAAGQVEAAEVEAAEVEEAEACRRFGSCRGPVHPRGER